MDAKAAPSRFATLRGRIRESLRASLVDGIFTSSMLGLVDQSLTPFAIALKATGAQVAHLASIPNLVAALTQSQANNITEWLRSRRKALLTVVFIQVFVILAISGVHFLPTDGRVTTLISLAIFYITLNGLFSPIWGSLMCEYLPLRRRSGYFGWRQRILGPIVIGMGLCAGAILQRFNRNGMLMGFTIVFLVGAICRFISWSQIRHMFEPAHEWAFRERRTALRLDPEQKRNFWTYVIFNAGFMGSVMISGPLQPLYLLRNLQLNYFTYMVLVAASNTTMFFMMGPWGRHADVSGNLKVIRLVSWITPVIPFLWLVSKSPIYLFFLQATSGIAWAGYNLCTTNFVYDSVPSSERVRATSIYNMANSLSIFLGAIIGGELIDIVPPIRGYRFLTLHMISGALRLAVILGLLSRVRETRHVRQVRSIDLALSVSGLRPLPGVPRETLKTILRNRA